MQYVHRPLSCLFVYTMASAKKQNVTGRLSSAQIFEYEVERKNCGGVQEVLALLCLKDVTTKQ